MYKNTQSFEFDLDKYTVDDLYNLFNLKPNTVITAEVLRKAKQTLIQVHPDKSNLPKEYLNKTLIVGDLVRSNIKNLEQKNFSDVNNTFNLLIMELHFHPLNLQNHKLLRLRPTH